MTISRKFTFLSFGMIVATLICFALSYVSVTGNIKRGMENTLAILDENDTKLINRQIAELGGNLCSYLTGMEDEIDKRMSNAAAVLQVTLLAGEISGAELSELSKRIGMDDLYIAGMDGIFTHSTEEAAIGVSLFGIWEGYRMLAEGKASELPSPIKIKAETGEIFKFTAIPRLDSEGAVTGILEAALEASGSMGLMLQEEIKNNPQLNAINIIDSTGIVLTANGKAGEPSSKTGLLKVGETVRDAEILNVASSGKPLLKWAPDRESVSYYTSIKRFGAAAYILYINVDPASYLENTAFSSAQFIEFEKSYDRGMMTTAVVSCGLIFFTVLLYSLFIKFGMLNPLKELSGVMENISDGSGDLTRRLKVRGGDEIGKLAERFNVFISKIQDTVKEAKNAADVVTLASSEVMSNVDSSYSGLKSVSERVKNLSENIVTQARDMDGCDEISELLLTDCEYLSAQIAEASKGIDKIMQSKESGEEKISTLTRKNHDGIEKNRKTADDILELNAQIADINNIIDEIKTVAKQTQLLSLNASIEAASAGEHGKGFTVVAASVKALAEQSANSALKIEEIISAIGQRSANNVETVTEVVQMAEEQNACVDEMRNTFSGIASGIDDINAVFGNVNQSLDKVSSVSEKMRGVIRGIRQVGLENQQSVESVGGSMDLQVGTIKNIKTLSDWTASTVNDLKETMNRFEVTETD